MPDQDERRVNPKAENPRRAMQRRSRKRGKTADCSRTSWKPFPRPCPEKETATAMGSRPAGSKMACPHSGGSPAHPQRRGLIQLLTKGYDLEEVRKTLLYEEECAAASRARSGAAVGAEQQSTDRNPREGRDEQAKGGRSADHGAPSIHAHGVVAPSSPTDEERGQWYFQRYSGNCRQGEIVFSIAAGTTARRRTGDGVLPKERTPTVLQQVTNSSNAL